MQDLSAEATRRLWEEEINAPMAKLLRSKVEAQQLGGLLAIEHLVTIEDDEGGYMRRSFFRLWNNAKEVLHDASPTVLQAMARTAGKIADVGGATFGQQFIEFEVPQTIDLLTADKADPGRYAGVLLLKELARNSPNYFYNNIAAVFDKILIPLRDPRLHVREGAADLLGSCLQIATLNRRQPTEPLLDKILQDAQAGLLSNYVEVIHGSLITLRELFEYAGMFMHESYVHATKLILKFRVHKDPLIRRTVMLLLPNLATYDTQTFCEHFLRECMGYLLGQLSKPSERAIAFAAIGRIAMTVKSEIREFLPPIMVQVRQCLQAHGKKGSLGQDEEHLFDCLAMLAESVGPHLAKLVHEQLDLIFACGLSDALFNALVKLSRNIPLLHVTIQERLLDMISLKLVGQPYRRLGEPPRLHPQSEDIAKMQVMLNTRDPGGVKLALEVLGRFDFRGHVLSEFVRDAVLPYLEDENGDVRLAAAATTCQVLRQDPIVYQTSNHATEIINEAVEKLLVVAVADLGMFVSRTLVDSYTVSDPTIRRSVLRMLDDRFDKYLAQAEHVRALFGAVHDEDFDNRLEAIALVGRVGEHNPAYVAPWLRRTLIQLITELQCAPASRAREDAARLLTALAPHAGAYALPLLGVLLPRVGEAGAGPAALECLGALAGPDFRPHAPQIIRAVLDHLSSAPVAALRTMGRVCAGTGYVVDPLVEHPRLLPALGRMLDQEQSLIVRREVVRVLGILGAIDPYRRSSKPVEDSPLELNVIRPPSIQTSIPLGGSATEEYYQSVVVHSLLGILADPSLASAHYQAIESIMSIFKTQGLKGVVFLPQIIPAFISVIMTALSTRFQEFHLQQLAILVDIVKQHIRNYLPSIVEMVINLWGSVKLHLSSVQLVEALARALDTEFRPFLLTTVPLLLSVFDDDTQTQTQVHVLRAFVAFGANLEEYLLLVVPAIVRALDSDRPTALRRTAAETVGRLARRMDLSDHAARLVHAQARVLAADGEHAAELRSTVMDTMCALLMQLGSDFAVFIPLLTRNVRKFNISHEKYESLIATLMRGERLPPPEDPESEILQTATAPAAPGRMSVNQPYLRGVWSTTGVSTKSEWSDWYRRICIDFVKESPSPALRACAMLLEPTVPVAKDLAKELFNVAFLSCWIELYEDIQEDLVAAIEVAIRHPQIPIDVAMGLLNLAEFMEHQDRQLPIENCVFGDCAFRFHAYAKALHYKELDFFSDTSPAVMESLININTKLQQHDAAFGILTVARDQFEFARNEEWFERLGRWQEALEGYNERALREPQALDVSMGRMRCLHALGEWDELAHIVDQNWIDATTDEKMGIAPLAAAAAWALNEWDAMDDYIQAMSHLAPERAFFRAVLLVHRGQLGRAQLHITRARDLLDPELSGLTGEHYGRNYNLVVRAQMLSELEEIIHFKQSAAHPERQSIIRHTWQKRQVLMHLNLILGCQPEVEVWQRVLQVRAIVLSPHEAVETWVKFANLCRKSERMFLAEKTINSLTMSRENTRVPPLVVYAHLKYLWASGGRNDALAYLMEFSEQLQHDLGDETHGRPCTLTEAEATEYRKLLARCRLKQGEWTVIVNQHWVQTSAETVIDSLQQATEHDPSWYKAWHSWALHNIDLVAFLEKQTTRNELLNEKLATYVVSAIQGLTQSILLGKASSLQDVLRLLTLWFKFGVHPQVSEAVTSSFNQVPVDTWIDVIPQIIARIQTPSANIRRNINILLDEIGKAHPQALVYPLTVASKSPNASRKQAGVEILERMKVHSAVLVEQALVVSYELIRVAILWHELWHDGLEEASQLYFNEKNPEGMIAALEPLHNMVERGATTTRELSFVQTFGRDLLEAREACSHYRKTGIAGELERAWAIYYAVFRKVEKQLPQMTTLDLQHVSPELLHARDLLLAVPGTYQPNMPILHIQSFAPKLSVIASKQRPRRMSLRGSDGREYEYALKGHEDLRQDERVMQFFGLVNTLLSVDHDSYKRRLHVQRTTVVPLAPNAGLVGWVRDTDTFHVLVRDYREARKILLNIENRLMVQMAPQYECLTLLQKVEVFQHAMDNTTGQDLYRVLWLKSKNSENWLERRTIYTRSLAVSSMVGYVLGLGDRHPSNILIDRASGKVIHIDFGDCFEVAMHRDKFPEKVPFRLTRMLIHAMEVSGIRGSYKNTCDITMLVLRNNRESLLAVLEAFIYDPLISWRLMKVNNEQDQQASDAEIVNNAALFGQGPTRKPKADERAIFTDGLVDGDARQEVRNDRALFVYKRVANKLAGRDFNPDGPPLSVTAQVEKLILQATSMEALCQHFPGWCACW
ncbi:atypical/PIKK/FRAP protein kinase [Auricularia subglabra TFB-10046 SS5]|nr:atypical/PIKK/FRAP protein kinase [Auricularia subglabra TFB-10046 SS5]